MNPNPLVGVVFHWLGGLASASFYVPYRRVERWSWEIYWLTGGLFSWAIAPWLFAWLRTPDLLGIMAQIPPATALWCILFGMLWGFGGLTYGLTMRYLGLSLGMAVVLGLCTLFGTLLPPLVQGQFREALLATVSGKVILLGLGVTLLGIVVLALAGVRKDHALSAEEKKAAVAEFAFGKGLAVALFSGVMSACFAFGLAAGAPIKAIAAAAGTGPLWTGLPILCLIMGGGLATNALWCAWLIVRNGSAGEWFGRVAAPATASSAHTTGVAATAPGPGLIRDALLGPGRAPLLANYLLCALAGTLWYLQFFFYTMGESQMGRFGFSSWTLHMASIIIFGTIWGFAFREWRGAPQTARRMVYAGVVLLVSATIVIGYGNALAAR